MKTKDDGFEIGGWVFKKPVKYGTIIGAGDWYFNGEIYNMDQHIRETRLNKLKEIFGNELE
jgi:hypothetical protein